MLRTPLQSLLNMELAINFPLSQPSRQFLDSLGESSLIVNDHEALHLGALTDQIEVCCQAFWFLAVVGYATAERDSGSFVQTG